MTRRAIKYAGRVAYAGLEIAAKTVAVISTIIAIITFIFLGGKATNTEPFEVFVEVVIAPAIAPAIEVVLPDLDIIEAAARKYVEED